MSEARLQTRPSRDHGDVASFFDGCASAYVEQHGDAERLLRYRLDLLRRAAALSADDTVLEIGCGNGLHLLALAEHYDQGLGIDLSQGMVDAARRRVADSAWREKVTFLKGAAESLEPIADQSVDVVLCVGSLEHMLDQAAALCSAFRVLRPGGRLAILTLNGGSLWYRYLAPALRLDTRQLETDRYLERRVLQRLVCAAGFVEPRIGYWTFIQRGDMPRPLATLFGWLDAIGKSTRIGWLRGGLKVSAHVPPNE